MPFMRLKLLRALLFNFYSKQAFNEILIISNKRLKSMSIDFSYINQLIGWLPVVCFFLFCLFTWTSPNDLMDARAFFFTVAVLLTVISFFCLNKDFFKAQSVAKRLLGYQVLNIYTNQPADECRCMLRNTTILFWPVEVLFALINPNRRLGDFIADTILVDVEKRAPESIIDDISEGNFGIATKKPFCYRY